MRAAVLTALMDDYDTLKPTVAQDGAEVQWVCLTDSTEIVNASRWEEPGLMHPTGWQIIPYERLADEHPNRAAKLPKTLPAMFTDAPASVWLDASFQVFSPRLVVDTLTIAGESPSGIAQFVHPWRNCLFDEVNASIELPKYAGEVERLAEQDRAYSEAGMPRNWGLWATGVIARHHRQDVHDWGRRWGGEIRAHSYQDQVSHPYVCWVQGLRPATLPGNHFHNAWLAYAGSGRH